MAGVLLQRVYLVLDGVGYIYECVGMLRSPHEDIADFVRLQAFLDVLIVVQEVAGIREYGVERNLPGYAVVAVEVEGLPEWVGAEYDVGLVGSDCLDEFARGTLGCLPARRRRIAGRLPL